MRNWTEDVGSLMSWNLCIADCWLGFVMIVSLSRCLWPKGAGNRPSRKQLHSRRVQPLSRFWVPEPKLCVGVSLNIGHAQPPPPQFRPKRCHTSSMAPAPSGPSCGWWAYWRADPCRVFELCPTVGPVGAQVAKPGDVNILDFLFHP